MVVVAVVASEDDHDRALRRGEVVLTTKCALLAG
jgi:hypothetical protein